MDRTERNEKDDSQKIKIVFLSGAALIVILLIISFGYTYKARNERDALKNQLETSLEDNSRLEQYLVDKNAEIDALKKQVQQLQTQLQAQLKAQLKAKPKPAPEKKKSAPAKKSNSKTKKKKSR